ncbi:EamA family transporter RarD [Roseospira marina]|uniref:EamA family transporter RarD n=1 Tax=Roseospira marina TaxID=140057 RepID=UPI001478B332|nr:EamA family transporter RarD [Roseospira marina]MBB4315734.1 chloramphenicol-sensitive protein RarD [Roseospira marina]MBB5088901.1 chloramphenicol-sensitive protein RarD [Roseospira marina]
MSSSAAPSSAAPSNPATLDPIAAARQRQLGYTAAIVTYIYWGLSPVLYHFLGHVPPLEVMAHRIVWGLALALPLVVWFGQTDALLAVLRQPRKLAVFAGSATAISINWLTFIYATGHGHKLDSSMGYYIFPLASVLLGALFLKERLSRWQWLAVGLASLGVLMMLIGLGRLPWVALVIAASFGIYGLLRKIAPAESLVGFTLEVLLIAPIAMIGLLWVAWTGTGALPYGSGLDITLLVISGPFTAVPLVLFALGARRLPLGTLGMLQYINPTIQFAMAVAVYGETFTLGHAASFALIWTAVALFAGEPMLLRRRQRRA